MELRNQEFNQYNEDIRAINKAYGSIENLYVGTYRNANWNVNKVDDPLLTTTTGVSNDVYGEFATEQFNQELNAYSAMIQKPYVKHGFRIIDDRGVILGSGGTLENAGFGDSVKPTFKTMQEPLAHITHKYDGSLMQAIRSNVGNDDMTIDAVKKVIATSHTKSIKYMLLTDVDDVTGIAAGNINSIDRAISSQSEETGCLDAGDSDIHGFDRSASTNFDAWVDHNSTVVRPLDKFMIKNAIAIAENNSGKQVDYMLTGRLTLAQLETLYESQSRVEIERATITVSGGVTTAAGTDVGVRVSMIQGIPVIVDDLVVADGLPRIYGINKEHLWIEIGEPTRNYETTKDQMVVIDKLGISGVFVTTLRLITDFPGSMFKIRDIAA